MPRVHKIISARKDYPREGIAKGESYFKWSIKTGPVSGITYRSKTPPRPSQLTASAFLGAIGDIEFDGFDGVEDPDGLRDVAQQIRELGEEQRGNKENMPDGLQEGDVGQMLEERADNCDQWADDIETAAEQLEEKLNEIEEAREAHAALAGAWDAYEAASEDWENGPRDPSNEPDPPEDDDPRDRDYDEERSEAITDAVEEAKNASPGF